MVAGSPRKATDEQLVSTYKELGSIWAVADKFKMCGQSVHERLQKLSAIPQWKWTVEEDVLLVQLYKKAGDNKTFLDELEVISKRHKSNICRRARKLNLTNKNRKYEEILVTEMADRAGRQIETKGMAGKTHSDESKKRNSISTSTARSRTVSGKRKDLSCFFRSKIEANYARFLNYIGLTWAYEPKTFIFEEIKRGTLSYTPDFYCPDNGKWYEVKGWFDATSVTRMKRFKIYYPEEAKNTVIVAQSKKTYEQALVLGYDVIRYEEVEKQYKNLPNWEK